LENKERPYVDTGKPILCVDQTRKYYLMKDEAEFDHCKTTRTGSYVCSQKVAECLTIRKKHEVRNCLYRGGIVPESVRCV